MKRRIIKQGHNTLTITLPSKWAQRFNLRSGDEVDVSDRDNGLYISTEKHDDTLKAVIDIKGLDVPTIWKYLMAVYREGYDEVKIIYDPKENYGPALKFFSVYIKNIKQGTKPTKYSALETIRQMTARFIGYEVIEHHDDYCIIKDMGESTSKEFETSMRRIFLLIQQMAEEMLETIKTNNLVYANNIHDADINVDKFHDYCIRVLNKTGFKEVRKAHIYFSTLYLLEMLGDEFKSIAFHIMEDMQKTNLKNILPLAELIMDRINKFYDFFYKFDRNKLKDMSQNEIEVRFFMPNLRKKLGKNWITPNEVELMSHFRRISRYLNALLELRIEMEF